MWQNINLINYADSSLIDAGTVNFNLAAWLGGASNQDDSAVISVTFADQNNQTIGSSTSIGPVLSADRSSQTVLLFQQTNGTVPASARWVTLTVTYTRYFGGNNDGYVDNIALYLFQ